MGHGRRHVVGHDHLAVQPLRIRTVDGSASLISLAHGTNDAQKTMGVIFLALISYGAASSTDTIPPLWVIVSCAVAIALGTYLGGWRVIRTMSKGLVEIE